jgi:DedD protein
MDRRVKERLVGASILVVLIVLVVPELLSGPATGPVNARLPVSAPEPVRNITVDLATSKPPEPVVEPPPASSAPAAGATLAAGAIPAPGATSASGAAAPPVSPAGTGDADEGAHGAPPAALPPATAPPAAPPLETATPSPTSSTTAAKAALSGHGWAVQLGSFASRANADKLVRQLKAQGFGVYVLSGGSGAAARYRVRVGPLADRNVASQTAAKLKASGHIGSLVAPSP